MNKKEDHAGKIDDLFAGKPVDRDIEDEDESDEVFSEEAERSRIFDESQIEELQNLFVESSSGNLMKSSIPQHNFSRSEIPNKSEKKF